MFTGLVEGLGTVCGIVSETAGIRLEIAPPSPMLATPDYDRCRLGDSVAINGCCLTVIAIQEGVWSFQAGEETLSKTNLGQLKVGEVVNLERALPVQARLGGHFVQGHVDGVGTVASRRQDGDWVEMWFLAPPELTLMMVPKGSITVDGVSLTVVQVLDDRFSVALIPHTLDVTTLGRRAIGDAINLETDILGKYVHKLLRLP